MLLLCRPLKHCNNVVCWPVFYYVQEKVKLAPDDFDPLAYFYILFDSRAVKQGLIVVHLVTRFTHDFFI
jgi:hypothetical protein